MMVVGNIQQLSELNTEDRNKREVKGILPTDLFGPHQALAKEIEMLRDEIEKLKLMVAELAAMILAKGE